MTAPHVRPPRVSVVIPVYNAAATLAETLDSLFAQTLDDFEAIVVDDGTPDRSMEIAARYDDPRMRAVHQENRGLNGARNAGIRASRADYIAFLDADDLWAPQMLARNAAHLDARPEVGVSYTPSILIDARSRPIGLRQRPKLTGVTAKDVMCRNPLGNGSAGMFRRAVFDAVAFTPASAPEETWWFDETYRQSTDIECWMRIAAQTDWAFAGMAEPLVFYRVHAGGLSADTDRQLTYWERALAVLAEKRPDLAQAYGPLARAYQLRYLARRAVSARDGRKALALMRRAFAENWRILPQEPLKTLTTLAAATALRAAFRAPRERYPQ